MWINQARFFFSGLESGNENERPGGESDFL